MAAFATLRRIPQENPIPSLTNLSIQQPQQPRRPRSPEWILLPESLTINPDAPLGTIGSSSTYRGTFERHHVAVRKFTPDTPWQALADAVQRSLTLQNPHVLQIFGVSHQSIQPSYMVYPLYDDGNVMQYIQRVPDVMRARLAYEVSAGMEYLHSMNIIHGRLKPSNVLVTSEGHACVTDYGLYQLGSMPASSPRYFSPEAWKGRTSKPSDVFAFAMTAFEIFTSSPPWGILTDTQIYQLMVREGERPDRPESTDPTAIADRDWQVLEIAWAVDPNARPTFAQVASMMLVPDPVPQGAAQQAEVLPSPILPLSPTATSTPTLVNVLGVSPAPPPYASPSPRPLPQPSLSLDVGRSQGSANGSASTSRSSTLPHATNRQRVLLSALTHVDAGELHQPLPLGVQQHQQQKLIVSNGLPSPHSDGSSDTQSPVPQTRHTRLSSVSAQQPGIGAMESANSSAVFGFGDTRRSSPPMTSPPMTSQFGLLSPRTSGSYSMDQSHFRSLTSPSIRRGFEPPSQRSSLAFTRAPYSEWSGSTAQLALGGGIPERAESVISDGSRRAAAAGSVASGRPSAILVAGALDAEITGGRNRDLIDGYLQVIQQLATDSQREAEKLVSAGVVPTLIMLLKSRAMDGQGLDLVLKTLGILARDPLSANTIFRTNTSTTLLEIIDTSVDEDSVALAIWCLSRLSRNAELAAPLIKSDLVSLLITKGLAGPIPTATASSWCLGNLVYNDDLADTLTAIQYVPQALVDNLKHALIQDPVRNDYIAAAIYAIARVARTIKLAKMLAKCGCVEPLIKCLTTSTDPDVLMWSARAVGCLMRPNSAEMSKTLLDAGAARGLARLPKVIPPENVRPLEAFAFTIQRFSIAEWGAGTRKALVEAGVVDSLLAALRTASDSTNPRVHIEIAVAISALGDVGGGEIRKEIVRAGGVDILKQVGKTKNKDVARACSMAVTSVTGNIWTRNTASAKAAMMHNWSGGCPDHQPDCPLPTAGNRINPYVVNLS
ncbi:hypothetical protein FS837_006205 [Tulasnella sp. UAMH 9824]|nr:hypothetical protein FS837_006205 [Tulasnella sp. UAMH 9824]